MKKDNRLKKLLISAIVITLTGCATRTIEIPVNSCAGWKPITYSSKLDSAETVKQIKAHNAFYDWKCRGKDPDWKPTICSYKSDSEEAVKQIKNNNGFDECKEKSPE